MTTPTDTVGDTVTREFTTYSVTVKDPKDHRSYSVAANLATLDQVRAALDAHEANVKARNGATVAKLGWKVTVRQIDNVQTVTLLDPEEV